MFDYNSLKWKRTARMVMRRDGYMCQLSKRYGAGANIYQYRKNTYVGAPISMEVGGDCSISSQSGRFTIELSPNRIRHAAD